MVEDIKWIELDFATSELLRKQYQMDYDDAGPKAPVSGYVYKGVQIESRFSVLGELETMKSIVDSMPDLMARRLSGIWCDSRCGANYVISVRPGLYLAAMPDAIGAAILEAGGGHNGVIVEEGEAPWRGEVRAHLEPDWAGDFDPDWDER